ncbi:Histone deacetylase complex subunit SAP18 [Paramyrothecium foliicola]|nr:Histone deacetylase complex subunit SAP18 [Paramyrothecium foliicola]
MSIDSRSDVDSPPPPFLVKLFHRNGQYYRHTSPEEFASSSLPAHISIYARLDCTLKELALELATVEPSILPSPSIGTRLAFQLVCPDLRATSAINNAQPRFAVKELGSIVIGQGSLAAEDLGEAEIPVTADKDNGKTLREAHFVVGDYVSRLGDGTVVTDMVNVAAFTTLTTGSVGAEVVEGAMVGETEAQAASHRVNGEEVRGFRRGRLGEAVGGAVGKW